MHFKSWYSLPVVAGVIIAILIIGKQDSNDETHPPQAPIPESETIGINEASSTTDSIVEVESEKKHHASDADKQQDLVTQLKAAGAVTRKNFQREVRTIALVPVAGSYRVDAESIGQQYKNNY